MKLDVIKQGNSVDVLKTFPDESIDCCITSPPYYGLRDYGMEDQIGLEETPEAYIQRLVEVFHEVKRVLKKDGTLWVNIGDTYNGSKQGNTEIYKHKTVAENSNFKKEKWSGAKTKDLIGIPWMLAFALRTDGWYLRQDIIWHKPNPMPESVKDRCTKSHEYVFLLSKSPHYYFDYEAIQEDAVCKDDRRKDSGRIEYDGKRAEQEDTSFAQQSFVKIVEKRNKRDVWSVTTKAVRESHFATYPEELVEPCILAGCRRGGVILDPFFGSGTTGRVALHLNRHYIGIELNPEYIDIAHNRTNNVQMSLVGLIEGVKV